MKEIKDKDLLDKFVQKHYITNHLNELGVDFKLSQYKNGEILHQYIDDNVYINFLVQGSISIYALRYDGTKFPIRYINEFTMLGDVELTENRHSNFLTEANSKVICLTIKLNEYRDLLLNDTIFLKFIIESLSQKLINFSESESKFNTFEEKFLNYLKEECPDNMISSVENTCFQLRCSRRQLQRVLKKLLEMNVIEKLGKGCYKLAKN